MYPELTTFTFGDNTIPVMTYGVCLTLAFGIFYWMLYRLSKKYQISINFLSVHLLMFVLVTFFVARFGHVILYAGLPTKSAYTTDFPIASFFLMSDFYFSLGAAMVGFFGTLLWVNRDKDETERSDILDIAVIAWITAAIIGYLGAFLGGQTYGIRSDSIFAVNYTNNPILAEYPRFPLALVYSAVAIFIALFTYIIKKLRPEHGLAAGAGAFLWGLMWFLGEWWNDASADNFSYIFGLLNDWKLLNFNQILSLCLMAWGAWQIAHIIPSPLSDWIIDIGEIFLAKTLFLRKKLIKLLKKIRKFFQR